MIVQSSKKSKKIQGVATIEFAIGFIFFWYMCAAWAEMGYMSYVSAMGDVAISRATQVAKKSEDTGFMAAFRSSLVDTDSIWASAINVDSFTVKITYLDSYKNLTEYTDEDCSIPEDTTAVECNSAEDHAIAVYHIDYDYQPLFNYFSSDSQLFSREAIVIQEYQRVQFEVN